MTSTPSERTLILQLLQGAVPERADEISKFWDQYSHDVDVVPSATGVTMNADATRIQFDTKTIDLFWLFGFSAWRVIKTYSPYAIISVAYKIELKQVICGDEERGRYEFEYRQRITSSQSLIAAERTADISWPTDVPKPTPDRENLDDEDKVASDLVALALAFALLHECRHVQFCADGNAPTPLPEEEIACDTWARDFMTSGLAAYAKVHGHQYSKVLEKRAMGIALAAVIIHEMTPEHARWGNRQYPPIAERLTAMIKGYNLPADSHFWPFAAGLLIALMRQENRPLDIVAHSSKEMVETLLNRLK